MNMNQEAMNAAKGEVSGSVQAPVPSGSQSLPELRGMQGRWAWVRAWLDERPGARLALHALSYVALMVVLILMYGRGDFSTPPFVYQDF